MACAAHPTVNLSHKYTALHNSLIRAAKRKATKCVKPVGEHVRTLLYAVEILPKVKFVNIEK